MVGHSADTDQLARKGKQVVRRLDLGFTQIAAIAPASAAPRVKVSMPVAERARQGDLNSAMYLTVSQPAARSLTAC